VSVICPRGLGVLLGFELLDLLLERRYLSPELVALHQHVHEVLLVDANVRLPCRSREPLGEGVPELDLRRTRRTDDFF